MFEEFQGIPMHPLLVHAAVVLLPLQVAAAIAYSVLPRFRRYLGWFVAGVAVAAPLAALVARLSGEALRDRLIRNGTSDPGVLATIQQHNDFADLAMYCSIGLGVLMLVLLVLEIRRSRAAADGSGAGGLNILMIIIIVLTLGAAGATGYYVFRTGDSGAKMTWTGR